MSGQKSSEDIKVRDALALDNMVLAISEIMEHLDEAECGFASNMAHLHTCKDLLHTVSHNLVSKNCGEDREGDRGELDFSLSELDNLNGRV